MDTEDKNTKAATSVWIALATLHRKCRLSSDFKVSEIRAMIKEQNLFKLNDNTVRHHISNNCVANVERNVWDLLCMTYRTGYARYRLFRKGDRPHPTKKLGMKTPPLEMFPEEYKKLCKWYLNSYNNRS